MRLPLIGPRGTAILNPSVPIDAVELIGNTDVFRSFLFKTIMRCPF